MTQPAARVGDMHTCPMVDPGPKPHVGGPVLPPGAPTVLVGGSPAARIGDKCACVGPPDTITTGAMPVRVGDSQAARMTSSTAHGGTIVLGCPTVLIGLAGISGNMLEGLAACRAAAAGRTPPAGAQGPNGAQLASNTPGQSYNNCGIESSRQIINRTGDNVTQEELLDQAVANHWATAPTIDSQTGAPIPAAQQRFWSGGTFPASRVSILGAHGVQASELAPTMANLESNVASGRGAIAAVWAGNMPNWAGQGLKPNTGGHAILVTGVEYDANGNPTNVIINDTGMGQCGQRIPYNKFQAALIGGSRNHVVTNNPIW